MPEAGQAVADWGLPALAQGAQIMLAWMCGKSSMRACLNQAD
jgi:hypothetical protein